MRSSGQQSRDVFEVSDLRVIQADGGGVVSHCDYNVAARSGLSNLYAGRAHAAPNGYAPLVSAYREDDGTDERAAIELRAVVLAAAISEFGAAHVTRMIGDGQASKRLTALCRRAVASYDGTSLAHLRDRNPAALFGAAVLGRAI